MPLHLIVHFVEIDILHNFRHTPPFFPIPPLNPLPNSSQARSSHQFPSISHQVPHCIIWHSLARRSLASAKVLPSVSVFASRFPEIVIMTNFSSQEISLLPGLDQGLDKYFLSSIMKHILFLYTYYNGHIQDYTFSVYIGIIRKDITERIKQREEKILLSVSPVSIALFSSLGRQRAIKEY